MLLSHVLMHCHVLMQGKMSRTWILYNKPEEPTVVHAGLLLALGLHGHLRVLTITDIYQYYSQVVHSFRTNLFLCKCFPLLTNFTIFFSFSDSMHFIHHSFVYTSHVMLNMIFPALWGKEKTLMFLKLLK